MASDDRTQGEAPPVTGESDVDAANPPIPIDRPAEDILEGSETHSDGGIPVSVFDIEEMLGSQDPNLDAVRRILENNKSIIEAEDENGSTALHIAAEYGLYKATKVLLESHTNESTPNSLDTELLHIACSAGHKDIVKLFLDHGVAIEARHGDGTPLISACWSEQVDVVKLLIAEGAKISVKDDDGYSPLFIASLFGNEEIAKLLIEQDNSNINHTENLTDRTALHQATIRGYESIATMLMNKSAKVDLRDSEGCTALHLAISENYPKLVNQLLEKGARTDVVDNDDWTALHFAARFSDEEIATKVLSKGARDVINVKDKHGWTALHIASSQGNESVMKALLGDKGIRSKLEINVKNNDENTALHLASALDGDVDQYKPDDEEKAIRQGAIIKYLLCAGADLKIKNKEKKTSVDLIMANDKPHRFHGLLAYVSQSCSSVEPLQNNSRSKKLRIDDLLVRPKFEELLSKLVRQDYTGTEINTILKASIYMILDILEDEKKSTLFAHLPPVLGLLIAGSSPSDELRKRLKAAAKSISDMERRLVQDPKKLQKRSDADPQMIHRLRKGSAQGERKEGQDTLHNIPEANSSHEATGNLSKVINEVRDILRDPQFSPLHKDDYGKFKSPKTKKELEGILEKFDAVVVQFYKERGASGSFRRHRPVNEVIYGAGPTTIAKTPTYFTQVIFEKEPKFTWVHLPSTNVRVLFQEITITN